MTDNHHALMLRILIIKPSLFIIAKWIEFLGVDIIQKESTK